MSKRSNPSSPPATGLAKKRARLREARAIESQNVNDETSEALDIEKYVQSRKYEVAAFEDAMKRSKDAAVQRAFQDLPRSLRRRASSHNVKLLPKRLRKKALSEMTPKKKQSSSKVTVLGKKRARRLAAARLRKYGKMEEIIDGGNIEPPGVPKLARVKLVRGKFARRQVNKVWLPTHLWHAKRCKMQKIWGYSIPLAPTEKSYRPTHRASVRQCIAFDHSYYCTLFLRGDTDGIKLVLGRICESGVAASGERYASTNRYLECMLVRRDEGKEICVCPALIIWKQSSAPTEHRRCLVRVHPSSYVTVWKICAKALAGSNVQMEDLRFEIGAIDVVGPKAAECLQTILLHDPTKTLNNNGSTGTRPAIPNLIGLMLPSASETPKSAVFSANVIDPRCGFGSKKNVQRQAVADTASYHSTSESSMFEKDKIHTSVKTKIPEQVINKRRVDRLPFDDTQIPVLIVSRGPDAWTIMMPWEWVGPMWLCLMYCPSIRFGGLQNYRQISLESQRACFPHDFLGTEAGNSWDKVQGEEEKAKYDRTPKAKRVSYSKLATTSGENSDPFVAPWTAQVPSLAPVFVSFTMATDLLSQKVENIYTPLEKTNSVVTISMRLVSRGLPHKRARIYKINRQQTQRWEEIVRQDVQPDDNKYPPLPPSNDIIGYVTSANFNLKAGVAMAVGCVSIDGLRQNGFDLNQKERFCLLRNQESLVPRLASWDFVRNYS